MFHCEVTQRDGQAQREVGLNDVVVSRRCRRDDHRARAPRGADSAHTVATA